MFTLSPSPLLPLLKRSFKLTIMTNDINTSESACTTVQPVELSSRRLQPLQPPAGVVINILDTTTGGQAKAGGISVNMRPKIT